MEQEKLKLNQLNKLIKIKLAHLNQESAVLKALSKQKSDLLKQISLYQQKYLDEVNKLNELRLKQQLQHGSLLDQNVDFYKNKWVEFFKDEKKVSQQLEMQQGVVFLSQKQLKELEDRHEDQQKELYKLMEDKVQLELADQIAIKKAQL